VTHPERSPKTPSPATGLFATLPAFLRAKESGAPLAPIRRPIVIACALLAIAVALLLPSVASAHFTRPFLHQITATPAGPFTTPGGLAVDAEDNLWLGEHLGAPPFQLDQFAPAYSPGENAFLQTLEIEGLELPSPASGFTHPDSIAINHATGSFYVTGGNTNNYSVRFVEAFDKTGAYLARFGPFDSGEIAVAVDNSTEPSAGSVYVAVVESGGKGIGGIYKFNAALEPVNFSALGANRITGNFGDLAVGADGNIYARESNSNGKKTEKLVKEYELSGEFVRSFGGGETPGIGESHANGGWGGSLNGIAVDPVSRHILVAVSDLKGVVDEFDEEGHFLSQVTEASEGDRLPSASTLAVDSHGDLYVKTGGHAVEVYEPGHFLPSLRLAEASQRKPTSATLTGEVNPEELSLSACAFEYVSEAAFDATGFSDLSSGGSAGCSPAAPAIPIDSNFHPVSADLTGLASGTTYRYRLAATSIGVLGGTEHSNTLAFTAPAPPAILSSSATNLSSTFADLHATIDPRGAETTYQFQYLTQADYAGNGNSFAGPHLPIAAPVSAVAIGSGGPTGSSAEEVVQQLGGLQSATTYRFRVVASNEIGTTEGPEATFATLPQVSPGLPDHRAYELVTPPNKGSAGDMFGQAGGFLDNRDTGYASESGDQFLLETSSAFGSFPASGHNLYVFSRAGGRWTATPLAAPSLGVQSILEPVFDPFDFSRVGFTDSVGSHAGVTGSQQTNLIGPLGGPYTTVHADPPVHHGSGGTKIVGASRDLSHVVLSSLDSTLAPAPGNEAQNEGSSALYEYSAGELKLANLKPNGKLFTCGAILGQNTQKGTAYAAVSTDGSRVFFTAPDPQYEAGGTGCWNGATVNAPQLYARSEGETVEVSAPAPGAPEPQTPGQHVAVYVGAAADGSSVFFLSEGELTADDAGIHDPELYRWQAEAASGCEESSPAYNPASRGCLTRVSAGEPGSPGATEGAHVRTVPAVSADGSAVYFTAFGALVPGVSQVEPKNKEKFINLYRYDTATGATAYVATIHPKFDYPSSSTGGWWTSNATGLPVEVGLNSVANYYTPPDGRYLLFASYNALTAYDNDGSCSTLDDGETDNAGGLCAEVYRYDAEASPGEQLICVSCNPSGAPPASNAFFGHTGGLDGVSAPPVRALSNDGSYAFFASSDALVPQDANGTLDVYQWHDGTISLISSGHDAAPSFLLGASSDGSDVFFATHARLVPADGDTAGDAYDARICTASDPCIAPPSSREGLCEGDACVPAVPAPDDPTPASLSFQGAGNVHETKPKKPRKHPKHHKAKKRHQKNKRANNNRRAGR
jgi:hypothetical protein